MTPHPTTGLYYLIVSFRPTFSRRAHCAVVLRRMADGRDYINDVHTVYGRNGNSTRVAARHWAKDVISGRTRRARRLPSIPSEAYGPARAMGIDPNRIEA